MNDAVADESRQILLVDDDITSLDIVSYVFEERGFMVNRCADGSSALKFVAEHTPDLILIDLRMPGIDGVETVVRMRGSGVDTIPIVAFTAVDDPELHERAIEAGCNEVLTKPCASERLVRIIARYLSPDN